MKKFLTLVVALLGSIFSSFTNVTYADAADKVALVVGNGDYKNSAMLLRPPKDARSIAIALKDIGFSVIEGENLNQSTMRQSFKQFSADAQSAKLVLIYFSGQALQLNGKTYVIPIDANLARPADIPSETIELDQILKSIESPSRPAVIVLDACRDNPFVKTLALQANTGQAVFPVCTLSAYINTRIGNVISYSAAPGRASTESDGDNSPFTTALLMHLKSPNLEVRQMLTRVRETVVQITNSQQTPWSQSTLQADVYLISQDSSSNNANPDQSNSALPKPQAAPSMDPVDRIWMMTRDTNSIAILEQFIADYPDSPYVTMAKRRIQEIQANRPNPTPMPQDNSGGATTSEKGPAALAPSPKIMQRDDCVISGIQSTDPADNWLALRAWPSSSADYPLDFNALRNGEPIRVLQRRPDWYQIRHNASGRIGWASARYISCP